MASRAADRRPPPWLIAASNIAVVSSRPVIQLARDGRWEDAVVLPISVESAELHHRLWRLATEAAHDIAVEILWPGRVFVGSRWAVSEAAMASTGVARAIAASDRPDGNPAHVLMALLDGEAPSDVAFAEMGAVNAWASVGPHRLWTRGRSPRQQDVIREVVLCRPDLAVGAHSIAIELAVVTPQPAWIGVTVSRPNGAGHRLDRRAAAELLSHTLPTESGTSPRHGQ